MFLAGIGVLEHYAIALGTGIVLWVIALVIGKEKRAVQLNVEISSSFGRLPAVSYPRSRADVKLVNLLARKVFPFSEPIDPERYEQWLLKNPHILVCFYDEKGLLSGYFDVLPLEDDFASKFVDGLVTECDIRHEHLASCDKAPYCKYIYLAGIAVEGAEQFRGKKHASMLLWGLVKYLKNNYGFNGGRRLLALAATPEGEDLLTKLQFQFISPKFFTRKDGHKLYESPMTIELHERLVCSIPDYDRMCDLEFLKCDDTMWKIS